MNLVELSLETLKELHGGALFQQYQRLLEAAVADCENRPGDKRPRKVSLHLMIKPVTRLEAIDERHNRLVLDGLKMWGETDVKCPNRKTMEFDCGVGDGHALLFNPDSPHNHRQETLPLTFDGEASIPIAG